MSLPLHNNPSTQTKITFKLGTTTTELSQSNLSIAVWAVALTIVAILIAGIGWQLRGTAAPVGAKASASVHNGAALYASLESGNVQQVAVGATLLLTAGDTITATTGSIQLTYFDGQTTELLPGASVTIQQLENRNGRTIVEILVNVGRVFNRIKRSLSDGEMFKVNTPSSAAAVRGTEFIVETRNATTAYYATIEGVVRVSLDGQSIDLRAGQEVVATQGQPLIAEPQTQVVTGDDSLTAAPLPFNVDSQLDAAEVNPVNADGDAIASGAVDNDQQELLVSGESAVVNNFGTAASIQAAAGALSGQPGKTNGEELRQSFAAGLTGSAAQEDATAQQDLTALQTSIAQQIIAAQQTAFVQKTASVQPTVVSATPTPMPTLSNRLPAIAETSMTETTNIVLTANQLTPTATPQSSTPTTASPTELPTPTHTLAPSATPRPTENPGQPSRPTKTPTRSVPTATHIPTSAPTLTWTPQSTLTIEPTVTPISSFTPTVLPTVAAPEPTVTPIEGDVHRSTAIATAQTPDLPTPTPAILIVENPDAIGTLAAEPTRPLVVTPIPTLNFTQFDTPTLEPTVTDTPEPTATHIPESTATHTPEPTATSVEILTSTPPMIMPTRTSDIIPTTVAETPTTTGTASPITPTPTATDDPSQPHPQPTHPAHPTHPPTPEQRATPKP
ncbi:MAG: FecR domain-containing protein [Caldilineaceae bacterium]